MNGQRFLSAVFPLCPKLTVVYQGGIGNQLFIHAAVIELTEGRGFQLRADVVSGFEHDSRYKRQYRLDELGIGLPDKESLRLATRKKSLLRHLVKRLLSPCNIWFKFITDDNLYKHLESSRNFIFNRSFILEGYFQSSSYSDLTFHRIVKCIKPQLIYEAKKLYSSLVADSNNAVCIHIRAFEDCDNEEAQLRSYYGRAIDYFFRLDPSACFYIIGEKDDVVTRLMRGAKVKYTKIPSSGRSDIQDLLLISCFSNIVISQSTFSWWSAKIGQVLGRTQKVVAPGSIKVDGNSSWLPDRILPLDWIRM
ncbi:hypothetical protein N9506_05630 [Pseudomonadales bacterium]|nr:hypothetical protein [Pseudomonadales bacterium]